jgi:periplasmic divalent cation tolerance protein
MAAPDVAGSILVLTTLSSAEDARIFVRRLVEARLVACGTVIPSVTSVYRWDGRVEEAAEAQVILKTRRERWEDLQAEVAKHHPYDMPELVAVSIETGLQAYLDWVGSETTDQEGGGA